MARVQQAQKRLTLLAEGLVLFGAVAVHAMADSCIWFADDDSIRQVQTSTNQVTHVIPLKNPQRLIMTAAGCGVWALDKKERKLQRYSGDGVLEREILVRNLDPKVNEVEHLRIDPYDESLWITDNQRIYHLTSAGQVIANFAVPGQVQRMQVALGRSLWVLGKRDLWHFDGQGALLASYPLGSHFTSDALYFEVDSLGGRIWLADNSNLIQLRLANPISPPLRIVLPRNVTGFTVDPFTGNVWVSQKEALLAYTRGGVLLHTVDLVSKSLRNPEKLAFDPVSRSLWAGTQRLVSRFTDSGEFVVSFAAKDGDEALGVPAFKVEPTLTLVRPPQNALTNNAQPLFTLNYGAACNSVACAFPHDYLAGYQLTATLNGLAVGPQFTFDLAAGQSSFTPATRLPEGANTFSAQVKDGFGLLSNTVINAFTVDTIAPRFLTVAPPNGTVIPTSQAILQGAIDDPQATVVLEGTGLNQTGANFSFPVFLQPGTNVFTLSAIDPAGNRTSVQRTLIRASLSINITAPAPSAVVSGSTALVTGTFQGPSNTGITVNGVVADIVADRFYASVPVQPGANVLTATAAALDGSTTQQSLNITSTGAAAFEVTAQPVSGVAPLTVSFTVNSAQTFQRVDADFDGNGAIDFSATNAGTPLTFTYGQPGVYAARFVITDSAGITTTQTVQVVVADPVVLDQQLKALWQGFAGALAARDKAKAMQYLTFSSQTRYGPAFDALQVSLPNIAASISAPQMERMSNTYVEYFVTRPASGGTLRVYLIYFFRDAEGIWRLEL